MSRARVVSAKNRPIKHVELSDGDWINLKRKLNYGESSELYDATYRSNVGGDRNTAREVRMSRFNMDRIFIYVLDWSFIDDENKPLPLSVASIMMLDTDTTEEIHAAINELEAENDRLEKAEEEAKKGAQMRSVVPLGATGVVPPPSNALSPAWSVPSQASGSPHEGSA